MMIQPFLSFPRRLSSSALPTLAYQTAATSGTDTTSYSFTSTAIGTDTGSSRTIIVGVFGTETTTSTISSITVGGVSGTLIHSNTQSAGAQSSRVAFYAFQGVSGTTATVAVTWSTAQTRSGIIVWAAYNLSSITAVATASSTSMTAPALNVNTSADGMVLACGHCNGSSTYAWTGVTERTDTQVETVGWSGGDASSLAAETPRSVSASISNSGSTIANAISISLR